MAVKFSDFTPGATAATTELVGYKTGTTTNTRYTLAQVGVGIFANPVSSSVTLESSAADLIFEMDNNAVNSANFQLSNGSGNNRADFMLNSQVHITMKGQRVGIVQYNPTYTLDVTGDGRFTSDLTVGGNLKVSGQGYSELHDDEITNLTFDWDDGNIQTTTMGASSPTFTPTNPKIGATYILTLVQTGTVTATWTGVKWPAATAPTLSGAGKTDIITLICYNEADAGLYYGSSVLNFTT